MPSVNEITVMGHLGQGGAEIKHTPNGHTIMTFSVATNNYSKTKKVPPTWHNVEYFLPKDCEFKNPESLKQGAAVYVTGKQQHTSYEKKDGSKGYWSSISARSVYLVRGVVGRVDADHAGQSGVSTAPVGGNSTEFNPDDVPF